MKMETGTRQDHSTKRQIVPLNLCTETFNKKDVDFDKVLKRAMEEFERVKGNSNGRSEEKQFQDIVMGHRVEQWLIDNCGFTDNPKPYQDQFDPNGISKEIKSISMGHPSHDVQGLVDGITAIFYGTKKRYGLNTRRWKFEHEIADKVYIFWYNKLTGDYTLLYTATANDDKEIYEVDHVLSL